MSTIHRLLIPAAAMLLLAACGKSEAPAPATGLPSAGQQLQAAREAAGQPLDALAQTLKVAVRKLEALEADRLDELPSPMFTRALASSVCRVVQ